MKKHIFAFICIFMLLFNTFAYTDTKAMDIGVAIDVGSDVLYYGWDMLQSLINGFVISLDQYSGYADKAAAMAAYYDDWGDVISVLTQGYLTPQEAETPAINLNTVYPLDFGMSNAVMRDFINQYGGFAYDQSLGMYADINMKSIASWNRYQDGWINRYLDAFNADIESHPTNPDTDFATACAHIETDLNGLITLSKPWYQRLDVPAANALITNTAQSYFTYGSFSSETDTIWGSTTLASCYINSANNTLLLTEFSGNPFGYYQDSYVQNPTEYYWGNYVNRLSYNSSRDCWNNNNYMPAISVSFSYTQSFNSLADAVNYVAQHFRKVNLYVDGELWAYSGTAESPFIDAPDVLRNENGDIIGRDVWFPEQDLKADLVKFTELIDDKILTGDTLTIDDVIDAGVLTDAEGNILTDENRDEYLIKKSVSTVISDALADDPTAGFVPDAPIPPSDDPWNWQFPTIVIPEGGDNNPRGTGLSVLARIVNVTNQGLPAELITMFWGIVITLLILGIIKILHK